jgi:hypothetical protein
MKNLYLFHYLGGTCGDFMCLEISKDKNFYSNLLIEKSSTNRWLGENPLIEFNLDYKENITGVSPDTYKKIDEKFQDLNLVIPAHMVKRNLPRLKVIRSYVSDLNYAPMFFILLYVKALMLKRDLSDSHNFLKSLSNLHVSHTLYKNLKDEYRNLSHPLGLGNKLLDQIEDRGYYYNFELRALQSNFVHMKNIVQEHFVIYTRRIMQEFPADINLPIDKMLFDPAAHVDEFSKNINMDQPLQIANIELYHQKNLDVIENIFNKPYDKLIQENWQDEFQEYINQTCPDNWFIQTNQQP